ncbi:hypothetical protein HY251_19530 [bacterium]|nr:hypothetical protein [bacterium]
MKRPFAPGLAVVIVLALAVSRSFSQLKDDAAREGARKLRETLGKEGPRASLEGSVRLSAHVGLSRAGSIFLGTKVHEKNGEKLYEIEDRLNFEARGMGEVHVTLIATLAADLSVRDLALETAAPGKDGVTVSQRLALAPESGALWLTETKGDAPPTKRKLDLDPSALVFTPPLGAGERLARLARAASGTRLSFEGWDLAAGERATLALAFGDEAKIDIRGASVSARSLSREEGKAKLECWLDPRTFEPLRIARQDGPARLVFVGREPEERADLPAPPDSARASEGPGETVLRFLRATGKGERAEKGEDREKIKREIASLLDIDALYARAKGDPADKEFRKRFEKVLLDKLTRDEWRRNGVVKLLAGAASAKDLSEEVSGETARVRPKSAPELSPFKLEKSDSGWRISGFPD